MKARPLVALLFMLLASALLAACAPTPLAAPVYTIAPTLDESQPAPVAAPVKVPDLYEVSKGDTLISIAMHYDLDYRELARWNNLRDPNVIQPGQQLRLTPPANDPIASAVPKQNAPALQPSQPEVARAEQVPDQIPKPGVQRQTTVIGGQAAAATPAPAPGTAPYKTEPQAIKYAYSKGLLEKLQKGWREQKQQAAVPKPGAAAAAAAAPLPTAVAARGAPDKTRQRYGVAWSLPASGAVLKRYDSQSKGTDFDGERGAPIYAAADGVVIYVGTGVKSYGRLVILRHENDYLSAYAHNEKIMVKEEQRVTRGSQIATMGDSGSERVMLHFEVRKGGKPLDPALVLPE